MSEMDANQEQAPTPEPSNASYCGGKHGPGPQHAADGVKPKGRLARRILVTLLLISLAANVYLGMLIASMLDGGLSELVLMKGDEDQLVVVYRLEGTIDGEKANAVRSFYRDIKDREGVRSVVLRVDSPGGYVGASDQIHRMVSDIRKELKLPVVVSMGSVAASGGYYISAPADEIFAEPTTITASIGVVSMIPIAKEFLEKHGMDIMIIRSTQAERWKAAVNMFEELDEEVLAAYRKRLDAMHARFEQVVHDGRGGKLNTSRTTVTVTDLNGKQVQREQTYPLNGQALLAEEALQAGLVDRIGHIDDAIDGAAKLAKLDKPHVIELRPRKGLAEKFGLVHAKTPWPLEKVEQLLSPMPMMLWTGR